MESQSVSGSSEHVSVGVGLLYVCMRCNISLTQQYYLDMENMGGSNEFFDKFTVRYHLSVLLGKLWEYPDHRSTIISESK